MMNRFALSALAIVMMVLLLPLNALAGEPLTDAEARHFVNQLNTFAKQRNHEKMMECFAPDAQIKIKIDDEELVYTKSEYYKKMKKGQPQALKVDYQATVDSVQVKGTRAMATLTVTESVNTETFGTLASKSTEVAIIEKRGGKLMITQLVANTTWNQKF